MKKNKTTQTDNQSQEDGHDREITQFCHAPKAKKAFVAGTSNDWTPDATPLRSQPDAGLSVAIPLAPCSYEYKFVADGQWCCAPGTPDEFGEGANCYGNSMGTMNCVSKVNQVNDAET